MAWWAWALILWAGLASAAVLFLAAKLSVKVELLAELSRRDRLSGHDLPADDPLGEPATRRRAADAVAHWVAQMRGRLNREVPR